MQPQLHQPRFCAVEPTETQILCSRAHFKDDFVQWTPLKPKFCAATHTQARILRGLPDANVDFVMDAAVILHKPVFPTTLPAGQVVLLSVHAAPDFFGLSAKL